MARPRFQFRLRTMFVVVTIAAVSCGWLFDHRRLVRERDEAKEQARNWQDDFADLKQQLYRREHPNEVELDGPRVLGKE